jgi:hypothetical protein
VSTEQDNEWARRRREELQKEAAVFDAQLAAVEQEYARSTTLLKMLGRAFGYRSRRCAPASLNIA